MKGHIDIQTLSRYFLNLLPPKEETEVQEHLHECPECAARLEAMRKLRDGFREEERQDQSHGVLFRIIHSGWTKAAAIIVLAAGISLVTIDTLKNRGNVIEQHQIINSGMQEDEVFAIDTFDKADSVYYKEKYGEDFKF